MDQDLPGSPTPCLVAAGSPLYYGEEEIELNYNLDLEIERTHGDSTVRASTTSPFIEVDEEQNYLEENLNSSLAFSSMELTQMPLIG